MAFGVVSVMSSMMIAVMIVMVMRSMVMRSVVTTVMMADAVPLAKTIGVIDVSLVVVKPVESIRRTGRVVGGSGRGVVGGFRGGSAVRIRGRGVVGRLGGFVGGFRGIVSGS